MQGDARDEDESQHSHDRSQSSAQAGDDELGGGDSQEQDKCEVSPLPSEEPHASKPSSQQQYAPVPHTFGQPPAAEGGANKAGSSQPDFAQKVVGRGSGDEAASNEQMYDSESGALEQQQDEEEPEEESAD